MNTDYDESIHSLSGAYAVDALDTVERKAFEAHLARCAECCTEVRSLREATALLALPDAVDPPPSLRDAVLAGAAAVRPLPPLTDREVPSSTEDETPDNVVPMRRRFHELGRRSRVGLAAAAVAAIVVGAGVVVQPWDPEAPSSTIVAASEILESPDAEVVSQSFPDGSRATVTRSVSEGLAVLETEDMPEPPSDRAFALWLMDADGQATPAGLMREAGDRTLILDGDAGEATAVAITVEPREGSASPTTQPIATFDLQESA